MKTESNLVKSFRVVAESLAFNPTEYDQFSKDIQREIERASPEEALALATVKLEAARRVYRAVTGGA